jgi:hypothetical protein
MIDETGASTNMTRRYGRTRGAQFDPLPWRTVSNNITASTRAQVIAGKESAARLDSNVLRSDTANSAMAVMLKHEDASALHSIAMVPTRSLSTSMMLSPVVAQGASCCGCNRRRGQDGSNPWGAYSTKRLPTQTTPVVAYRLM